MLARFLTGALARMLNWRMANWLIQRTDHGESAYSELAYGKTTSYLPIHFMRIDEAKD